MRKYIHNLNEELEINNEVERKSIKIIWHNLTKFYLSLGKTIYYRITISPQRQ